MKKQTCWCGKYRDTEEMHNISGTWICNATCEQLMKEARALAKRRVAQAIADCIGKEEP